MPVIIEHITAPTPADQVDLIKLYNDAPEWLQTSDTDQWLLEVSRSSELHLYAARFNDHLLGAAVIAKSNNDWQLTWIGVRTITRNRGIGRRMISELQRIAGEHQCQLTVADTESEQLPTYLSALKVS